MSTTRWRLRTAWILLATAVFLVAGCGEDAILNQNTGFGDTTEEMAIDLALEDGGMGTSAEQPNFGEPYFANYLTGDVEVAVAGDPLSGDPRLARVEGNPDVEVKYLRVVWGNLSRGPEADATRYDGPVIDWSGGARVSDGVLMPLRTIRFERNDYIIPPWRQEDPSRQKVLWVSHTGPGKDGILFKIVVPAPGDDNLDGDAALRTNGDGLTEDDVFVFRTEAFQMEFPLAKIQDLDELHMIDDTNGISFVGFDRDDIDLCPRGTMEGAWVRVENDAFLGGFFRAKWMGPLGNVVGHVRGRWGVRENGEKVFVGKIIARTGAYVGHMRGTWEHGDTPGRGTFAGGWGVYDPQNPDRGLKGRVRGAWAVSDRIENGGFLRGVWAAAGCDSADGDDGA
jgi:hypothetical protein